LRWASFFWIQSSVKDGGARAFFDNLDHSIIKTRAGAHEAALGRPSTPTCCGVMPRCELRAFRMAG
jgi:hypothetical protein